VRTWSARHVVTLLRRRGAPSVAMGVTPHHAFDETCPGLS